MPATSLLHRAWDLDHLAGGSGASSRPSSAGPSSGPAQLAALVEAQSDASRRFVSSTEDPDDAVPARSARPRPGGARRSGVPARRPTPPRAFGDLEAGRGPAPCRTLESSATSGGLAGARVAGRCVARPLSTQQGPRRSAVVEHGEKIITSRGLICSTASQSSPRGSSSTQTARWTPTSAPSSRIQVARSSSAGAAEDEVGRLLAGQRHRAVARSFFIERSQP